jgi:hypothetical protein
LWILDTGKTEVADLEIAVFIDEDVTRLQIAMDDTRRVDIFETTLWKISPRTAKICLVFLREFDRESTE